MLILGFHSRWIPFGVHGKYDAKEGANLEGPPKPKESDVMFNSYRSIQQRSTYPPAGLYHLVSPSSCELRLPPAYF